MRPRCRATAATPANAGTTGSSATAYFQAPAVSKSTSPMTATSTTA